MVRLCSLAGIALALMLATAQPCSASILVFVAKMDGPSEDPPNASPATGFARVDIDTLLHTMRVQATFEDLVDVTTVAHIHGPTLVPGTGTASPMTTTPTFPGFPVGVTSGVYDETFDLTLATSYRAGFITASGGTTAGAEAALIGALLDGKAYFNVHSSTFPGGEIRGFFHQVPEPSSFVIMGAGALGMLGIAWRRRNRS